MEKFLGVLIGLLVGGALGFGLARMTETERVVTVPARETATRPTPVADEEPVAAHAPDASAAPAAQEAPATSDLEAQLRAVAAESARASGTGTIRGTVRTPSGAPVAGVRVRATVQGVPKGYAGKQPHESELGDYLTDLARYHGWARGQYRESETDAEGRYILSELVDENFMLSGVLEGYQIELKDRSNWQCRPGRTVDFTAHQSFPVAVSVLMPDGTPAESASITVVKSDDHSLRAWTLESPRISLPPGSCELTAELGEEYKSKAVRIHVTEASESAPVVLQLQQRTRLTVRVHVPSGEDGENVHVKYMRRSGSTPPSPDDWESVRSSSGVQSNGTIDLNDMTPGHYFVGAGRSYRKMDAQAPVEVKEGANEVELTLPPMDAEQVIVVWVVDAEGIAIQQPSFACEWSYESNSRSQGVEATRKQDGSWWIHLDPEEIADDSPRGEGETVELQISAQGHGTRTVPVAFGKAQEIHVQFGASAQLQVSVSNLTAGTIDGELRFALQPPGSGGDGNRRSSVIQHSDHDNGLVLEDGTSQLGPIEAGEYDLVLTHNPRGRDHYYSYGELQRIPITLVAGDNKCTVEMPALYELSVEVPEGERGEQISLNRTTGGGMFHATAKIDELQRARFSCLLAGEYMVRGRREDGFMKVTLPGPTNVLFQPSPVNALRVSIEDTSKYLASVGFEDDDLIIGMDGTKFESLEQMQLLFVTAMTREEASFMVLRAGTETSVKINPKEMQKRNDQGGSLEPATR